MTSFSPVRFLALCGALTAASFTAPAHAGFADCGNINVSAEAKCKAEVSGGCTAQCTPLHFEAACAGKLEAECTTKCNKLPEVSCTADCNTHCNTQCNVNPGTFNCEGSCTGKCEANCSAKCSGSGSAGTTDGGVGADAQGKCEASCKATCGGECHASCTGTPPTADCTGKCEASCNGSCKADLNMDCQTNCQADGYVSCEGELQGGCETQCTKPEGAIFCDGQYVDEGGHGAACVKALNDWLKQHVDVSARGSVNSGCDGSVCGVSAEGEVKASSKCSVSRVDEESDSTGFVAALAGLVGLAAMSRRKRH